MTTAADLIGAMLGTLYLTLGLAAAAASALRSAHRDRALLWFGVFTALYGVRLIARSDVVQSVTPFTPETWQVVEEQITYVILVPAALLASAALWTGNRVVLRYLWVVNLGLGARRHRLGRREAPLRRRDAFQPRPRHREYRACARLGGS